MRHKNLQHGSLSIDYSALFNCIQFSVKHKILQSLFAVLIFFFFLSDTTKAEELIWPIDYYKIISSTFGEPRSGRFHYGVDFKSGGTTGKKIYAVGDGYISQVRTSPYGYGKALYIQLDSGEIVLYGHLSKFLSEIEDMLFRLLIQKRSYDIQWWPEPNEFRVKKGQVIAFSGDTGSGAPHLHLEIRDENNNPLNPMAQGLKIRDTIPPSINSVVVIPLDNKSSVDGFPVARWYDFSSPNTTPIFLSGRIGIAASVWDTVNDSKNLLAVYQISLAVDSSIIFLKCYNTLSYLFNRYGSLDYLSGEFYGGNGSVSALFRRNGNFLDIYEGNGILIDTTPESINHKKITIRARDYANNQANRTLPVAFGKRPIFQYCGYNGDGKIRIAGRHTSGVLDHAELWKYGDDLEWNIENTYFILDKQCDLNIELPQSQSKYKVILVAQDSTESLPVTLKFNPAITSQDNPAELKIFTDMLHDRIIVRINSEHLLSSIPIVRVEKNGIMDDQSHCPVSDGETSWITAIPLQQPDKIDMRIYVSAYDQSGNLLHTESEIDITVLNEFSNSRIYAPDSLMTLDVDPGALYRSAPARVIHEHINTSNGLKQVSQGYRIIIGDEPLKNSIHVNLTLDSDPPEKAALFITNGNENTNNNTKWRFVSSERKGNVFHGDIGSTGCLAVLTDTTPPYVMPTSPKPGSTIKSRKPLLRAQVQDKGSGIGGSDSIKMSIDSIPIYGEYDFEAHRVSYILHNNLQPGKHTVKVTVTDRLGNAKTKEWTFRIAE